MFDLCISTSDNPECLASCLTALSFQTVLPATLHILDEGFLSANENAAVRHAIDLLDLKGFRIAYSRNQRSKGICNARNILVTESRAPYIWFVDDDVIVEPECGGRLYETIVERACGFVEGTKCDVNNIRRFSDFKRDIVTTDLPIPKVFFEYDYDKILQVYEGDTGNIMFHREKLFDIGGFNIPELFERNLPGEDYVVTIPLAYKHLGFLRTGAKGWHSPASHNVRWVRASDKMLQLLLRDKVPMEFLRKTTIFEEDKE